MKNKEQKLQEKYLELQLIDQQIKQLQQQLTYIEEQVVELRNISEAIEELKNIKENSKIFFTLSPGILIEGKITKKDEFVVNIGGGCVVKKTAVETKELIDNQVLQLENLIAKLQQDIVLMSSRGRQLQDEIAELAKE